MRDAGFAELLEKIERERGFRGALYRQKCLRRRVAVRMRAREVATPEAYAAVLDNDPGEYDRLMKALTINVSKFFRNPETWAVIRSVVFPELLDGGRPRLFWSAGSAAGEEVYSIAILAREWLESAGKLEAWRAIRIIGTDIDLDALDRARGAEYSELALSETPPRVRERWFTGGPPYRLREPIRSKVEFLETDILARRPDFEADLILCRNLLIYLDRPAQQRVFETFAEALRPGGFLVLGRVETLSPAVRDFFEVVDLRERVYRGR